MTFGEQNTLEEGVQQLDEAFGDMGINFLDTAEMVTADLTPHPSAAAEA